MRAIIGILSTVDDELNSVLKVTYARAIEKSGGLPLLLPYVAKEESLRCFTEICDGFLFTGGVDIEPQRYGESTSAECGEIQLWRDELDFRAFDAALSSGKPILAVCRGAQLVNVALGGTLYQDIDSLIPSQITHSQAEPLFSPSHSVTVCPETPLYRITGAKRIAANSFHHQAIKTLGKGLRIMAAADDGIIEAIYLNSPQYLCAYQWHPERLFGSDEMNRRIFEDFITACANKK